MSITIKNGEETTEVVMEQLYTSGGQGGVDLAPIQEAIEELRSENDAIKSTVEDNYGDLQSSVNELNTAIGAVDSKIDEHISDAESKAIKTEYDEGTDTIKVTVPNSTV